MASEPPKPSIDPGRVIGRGFEALKANFVACLGFALLLVGVPGFVGQYLVLTSVQSGGAGFIQSPAYWAGMSSSMFGTFLGTYLLQGMLTRATILHLSGREPEMGRSALVALRLLLPLIGLAICVGFLIVIGFILLIVPGIMIWCALAVAVPILVEERRGIGDSIARSRELTRGSRFQIFLLGILFWVFSMIISAIAGLFTGISILGGAVMPDPLLSGAATGLSSSLTALISTIVIAALYVELREVREGVSANQLADIFG